ncbi:hypothetical protein PR048_012577 [Dryococelus australis]|uniref:DNA helicase n=1 Tax=Dryococelus australis TaxID=614101 RepID=A0ABQ9HPT1_9NEOP|nr:hypothetical protein PR048_012577 [Dryococelus australis]
MPTRVPRTTSMAIYAAHLKPLIHLAQSQVRTYESCSIDVTSPTAGARLTRYSSADDMLETIDIASQTACDARHLHKHLETIANETRTKYSIQATDLHSPQYAASYTSSKSGPRKFTRKRLSLVVFQAVSPRNDTVNEINNLIIQRVPGQVKTYKSIDTVTNVDDVVHFPQDFLNSLNPSGLPPHELSLKVDLKENLIVVTILTGPAAGQLANIPRIPMIPTDLPISFKRELASYQGEPGSIRGRVSRFSLVGIVPDDAIGRRVFLGISRFPRPFIPAPPHSHFNNPHRLSRPLADEVIMEHRRNARTEGMTYIQESRWKRQILENPERNQVNVLTRFAYVVYDLRPSAHWGAGCASCDAEQRSSGLLHTSDYAHLSAVFAVSIDAVGMLNARLILDLSSESDSDFEMETVMLLLDNCRRRKGFWRSEYMEKRGTHGEFVVTNELSDSCFRNYCRLTRNQFEEVHSMIEEEIGSEGCNAQKPIWTREKLAVFLRYLATGDSYRRLAYSYRMGDRTRREACRPTVALIIRNYETRYKRFPYERELYPLLQYFSSCPLATIRNGERQQECLIILCELQPADNVGGICRLIQCKCGELRKEWVMCSAVAVTVGQGGRREPLPTTVVCCQKALNTPMSPEQVLHNVFGPQGAYIIELHSQQRPHSYIIAVYRVVMLGDAVGGWPAFLGISCPFIPAPCHTNNTLPSSALKTSVSKAVQIAS